MNEAAKTIFIGNMHVYDDGFTNVKDLASSPYRDEEELF
jgi:thymidylate synthase